MKWFSAFLLPMPLRFQNRPALVAYLTCGDPDLATTLDIALAAIDAGAEVIELGVPFSDPVADGPVIQRASERALRHGTSLSAGAGAGQANPQEVAGRTHHLYLSEPGVAHGNNEFRRRRPGRLCGWRADHRLAGGRIGDYLAEMQKRNLATVFLAAPTSTDERLKQIAAGLQRVCVCGFANRSDRSPAADAGRRAETGGPPAQVY